MKYVWQKTAVYDLKDDALVRFCWVFSCWSIKNARSFTLAVIGLFKQWPFIPKTIPWSAGESRLVDLDFLGTCTNTLDIRIPGEDTPKHLLRRLLKVSNTDPHQLITRYRIWRSLGIWCKWSQGWNMYKIIMISIRNHYRSLLSTPTFGSKNNNKNVGKRTENYILVLWSIPTTVDGKRSCTTWGW